MLAVEVDENAIRIGPRLSVFFQRTLRIPDDGRDYPLPPGFGHLPLCRVEDAEHAPDDWKRRGGVILPMYQREAMWLLFNAAGWKPNAVQVAVGGVNAITGRSWSEGLSDDPQNYIVCPNQPWLDGINAGEGIIRQFVAVPLGSGDSVEAQVTGKEEFGGLQIRAYEPKPGRFPDQPPPPMESREYGMVMSAPAALPMGLGAGGRMRQKIYPDPYGLDTWDPTNLGEVCVHIVISSQFLALTGREPPPSPIDAKTYTERGYPWFDLYDESQGHVPPSPTLDKVKSVRQRDEERGDVGREPSLEIDPAQVRKVRRHHDEP